MYNFTKPNYKKDNLINLMSSISHNFDKKHDYKELNALKSTDLKKNKNIILIVIDGLGYNYLQKHKNSFLTKNIKSRLSSTFLSTTACANTAFSVGYPPQQHALTGWDINLKEIGAITTILPFSPIFGENSLDKNDFKIEHIMDIPSFHKDLNCESHTIIGDFIADSPFTTFVSKHSNIVPTKTYEHTILKIKDIVNTSSENRKFIHSYIPEFDSMAHKKGISSKEVDQIFFDLNDKIENLIHSLKDTDSKVIIISDHGFIDASPESEIWIEDIEGFKECLTIPLAGEQRVRDCFVRPRKVKEFEKIVKEKLSPFCWCFKGEDLIKDNFYGLGSANPKLYDRVGDYVLIMKDNYILSNKLANYTNPEEFSKGKHGGVSDDEMFIPLITFDC